jgi:hypothetical protein
MRDLRRCACAASLNPRIGPKTQKNKTLKIHAFVPAALRVCSSA